MKLRTIFEQVPDPRGKQGQEYQLWSLLALVLVGFLCGRPGLMAVFRLGRKLTAQQRQELGFMRGTTPAHATLTETMRRIDGAALAAVLGAMALAGRDGRSCQHIAFDGKTLRASKDGDGRAVHCVSAFCVGLQQVLGHTASRGKGLEIPDALALLKLLDLTGKVLTGDALMCQKAVAATIVDRGGDYVLPVKDNQKNLKADIMTAFETPVFPLSSYTEPATKAHGRIEQRSIDVLPAAALGPLLEEWPSVRQIARVTRKREVKRKGVWVATDETAWLITSLSSAQTSAAALLAFNRNHWSIENQLHRNKDVTLDEDKATNRKDNAPRNIFSLKAFVVTLCAKLGLSPTLALETFQDDKNAAIALFGRRFY